MSNIEASEENTKSPSTYGDKAYEEYRKIRKKNQKQVLDNDNNHDCNDNVHSLPIKIHI
jgi:hypothetical protein